MRKDIIVTGGTGFIGSSLAKELAKTFDKKRMLFLIWDKESPKEMQGRKVLAKLGVETVLVDLNKSKTLNNLPKNPTIVIHLAASTDTLNNDHRVNFQGTKNLVKSLKPSKKTFFVHISTVADMSGRNNLANPITEEHKPSPTNEYGRSKMRGERYIGNYAKKHNMPYIVLRLNTVYGPGENGNHIFKSIDNLADKNSFIIRLNWPGKITIIHKDDIIKSIIKIIKKQRKYKNKTYILGTETLTFGEICEAALEFKNKSKMIRIPNIFWIAIKSITSRTSFLEGHINFVLYNWLWRLNLIANNVFWCDTSLWHKEVVDWKTKEYKKSLKEVYS